MTETRTHRVADAALAPRRRGGRVGAVDEYTALQHVALDRVVHQGLDAAAAALRLRAEADRLVTEAAVGGCDAAAVVARYVDATEAAIRELDDEFRQLTVHVLRMARYRLGLC
jgi:hypothetical protein